METLQLSIVIPAFNSAENLSRLLESAVIARDHSPPFEVIINDDPRTSDETSDVIEHFRNRGLPIVYLQTNNSRSQGRVDASAAARSGLLLHLDSDMEVSQSLFDECVTLLSSGAAGALIIPEESFGDNFFARCRWLEKQIYDGVDEIEALRCLPVELYNEVGRHRSELIFSEDKDLDLRVRASGANVVRTRNVIRHNEGAPTLRGIFEKKRSYCRSAHTYRDAHREEYETQVSLAKRLRVLVSKPRLIARHPLLFGGLLAIGAVEYAALLASRSSRS